MKENSVLVGNYGFVYVSPKVIKKLKAYIGRREWSRVGSVSLVVKPGGQYFQVSDFKFQRVSLIPIAKVVKI